MNRRRPAFVRITSHRRSFGHRTIGRRFESYLHQPLEALVLGSRSRRATDIPGFCKSATLEEIAAHGFVLTPGRYVGAEEQEDDGEPFEEKMSRLVSELETQFAESVALEQTIREKLSGLGYGG